YRNAIVPPGIHIRFGGKQLLHYLPMIFLGSQHQCSSAVVCLRVYICLGFEQHFYYLFVAILRCCDQRGDAIICLGVHIGFGGEQCLDPEEITTRSCSNKIPCIHISPCIH